MKIRFLISLLFSSIVFVYAQSPPLSVYYEINHYQLDNNATTRLDSLVNSINSAIIKSIVLKGHTDTTASITYNQWLSEQRVQSVKQYLIKKGIASDLLQTAAYGESAAVSPANLRSDRRVDLYVNSIPTVAVVPTLPIEDSSSTSIIDLYQQLHPLPQEFCIATNKDTIIHCKEGTIIILKAHSFQLKGKTVGNTNCIHFQVKECYLKSTMIRENVTTTTETGAILATQGMVYTNAMLGQDTLELVKDIVIIKPTDQIVDELKVLDGRRNVHSDAVNWTLNNNSVLRNFDLATVEQCVHCLLYTSPSPRDRG